MSVVALTFAAFLPLFLVALEQVQSEPVIQVPPFPMPDVADERIVNPFSKGRMQGKGEFGNDAATEGDLGTSQTGKAAPPKQAYNSWKNRQWSGARVPYRIVENEYSQRIKTELDVAIHEIERATCVSFQDLNVQPCPTCSRKLRVIGRCENKGCFFTGDTDTIVFDFGEHMDNCSYGAGVMHQLLHALGFGHEHQRSDAWRYITIVKSHVKPDKVDQLDVIKNQQAVDAETGAQMDDMGFPYDFTSIMHLGRFAFTKCSWEQLQKPENFESCVTIRTHARYFQNMIGQRDNWSEQDIAEVFTYYKCHSRPSNKPPFEVATDPPVRGKTTSGSRMKTKTIPGSKIEVTTPAVRRTTTRPEDKSYEPCYDKFEKLCLEASQNVTGPIFIRVYCQVPSWKLNCRGTCLNCKHGRVLFYRAHGATRTLHPLYLMFTVIAFAVV